MKIPALCVLLLAAGVPAKSASLSLPVPAARGVFPTGPAETRTSSGAFEKTDETLWPGGEAEPPPFARLDLELPEFPATPEEERQLCQELTEAAARMCGELNELNRRIYDLSAARASATGQEFRGIPLSPEETALMTELRAAQFALAGEAQEMAFLLAAVENEAEARGCVFESCHRRNLDPSVETSPHYLSRENAAAVHHVQVAPWRPVRR